MDFGQDDATGTKNCNFGYLSRDTQRNVLRDEHHQKDKCLEKANKSPPSRVKMGEEGRGER
jgi:hypothetical protein